jgi:hypothetical protein
MRTWILILCVAVLGLVAGCRAPEDVRLNGTMVTADASYQAHQIRAAYPDANAMPALVGANLRTFLRIVGVQETVNAYLQHRRVDANVAVCP